MLSQYLLHFSYYTIYSLDQKNYLKQYTSAMSQKQKEEVATSLDNR